MVEILNCRMCGARAETRFASSHDIYWLCTGKRCRCVGPSHDEDGTKWNALMALPFTPPEGAVKVEIQAIMCGNGDWAANTQHGQSAKAARDWLPEMISEEAFHSGYQFATVTAYLMPPAIQCVEGVVSDEQ